MNVDIGAEATLFPGKEYISGIFVAVYSNALQLNDEWNLSNGGGGGMNWSLEAMPLNTFWNRFLKTMITHALASIPSSMGTRKKYRDRTYAWTERNDERKECQVCQRKSQIFSRLVILVKKMEAEREVVKIFPVSDLGTAFFRLQLLLTASSGHCRVQRAH
jgi:hypothetical protein